MKILTRNYLIFVAICILLLVYFYFNQYFFTINLYDTYYLISYFFFVIAAFIIGSVVYLRKISIKKLKNRVEQSNDRYSKYLLLVLAPNLYFKLKKRTRNYIIFLAFCILLFLYLYLADFYYLAIYDGAFHFISYYYFVLPILIFGTIFYLVKINFKKSNL